MKKMALHWKIMIGMVLGILFGFAMTYWNNDATPEVHEGTKFVQDWIAPWGKIFVNLLKLIAVPLIFASLIKGIADLGDITKFKQIGGRTIAIYLMTTLIAVTIGLGLVNIVKPGSDIKKETLDRLIDANQSNEETAANIGEKVENAKKASKAGPLQFVVDMVPENVFGAASDNGNMLQVIFFVLLFGICLLLIDKEKAAPIKDFFDGLNEVVLKMVDLIMLVAPYAVFALLASVIVSAADPEILKALLEYSLTVLAGLMLLIGFYVTLVYFFTGRSPRSFLNAIAPAQLVAFSTSSSAATLPVTMERVEEHLGVEKEVTSFVCPVGATVNMDGTSLYQGVAAVFICYALDYPLSFADQLTIVLTASLASIGSAAVPSAGMVMLVIVLQSIGFPEDKFAIGLALIFAVDRPLDMCRTVVNVTGDATVAMLVGKSVGKLGEPKIKEWDDNYDAVK